MNLLYLASVVISRVANMISVILFSYLLSGRDLGIYATIATNAMLLHILFGAWAPSYAWRAVSIRDSGTELADALWQTGRHFWIAAFFQFIVVLPSAALLVEGQHRARVLTVVLLSLSILAFETTLVVMNSQGRARDYAGTTAFRGLLTLLFAAVLILLGFGFWGAAIGSLVANIASVAMRRKSVVTWMSVPRLGFDGEIVRKALLFGIPSVLILNIYIVINAVLRNIVAFTLGAEEIGYVSLASDMFYAPLAAFATALSLSYIPKLYAGNHHSTRVAASEFLTASLVLTIPFCVGGVLEAKSLCLLVLETVDASVVSDIAVWSVLQAGMIVLLSTLATIGMTCRRTKVALAIALLSIFVASFAVILALSGGGDLQDVAEWITFGLAAVLAISLPICAWMLELSIDTSDVVKATLASLPMVGGGWVVSTLELPLAPAPEIVVGGGLFLIAAMLLKLNSLRVFRGRIEFQIEFTK